MRAHVEILNDIDMRVFDRMRQRLVQFSRVNVGFPGPSPAKRQRDEPDSTTETVASIAAKHEFGSPAEHIPERPFLRVAVRDNVPKYKGVMRAILVEVLHETRTMENGLEYLGVVAVGDVKQKIRIGPFTPNAPATVYAKGSSRPLIDTGQMIQSVNYEVESNAS